MSIVYYITYDYMIHAIGNVNHGGEALSDGDLHIYGKLLGRAICGLKGSYASSVYCQYFDPRSFYQC